MPFGSAPRDLVPDFCCLACEGDLIQFESREDEILGVQIYRCEDCGQRIEVVPTEEERTPAKATRAAPGSAEKIEVMRQRAERGEALFHPGDSTEFGRAYHSQAMPTSDHQTEGRRRKGRKGTGVIKAGNRWRASVWDSAQLRTVRLGLFETEEEALAAVAAARKRLAEG